MSVIGKKTKIFIVFIILGILALTGNKPFEYKDFNNFNT